ncbi:MAG: AAA family ATPase [Nostoc sp. DedQUE12b]|uniref:AAA family ATPase n=1 Tax=Nostoc sp. DedQUE12b TaxID=3075398 RepID=UPI002AD41EAE|nr:AAA family ATPase [Nostoc sp. DedQUE12b]MDZ8090082.1 AAA family ATPase [Nostoc sp. DedQUE12b]
MKVKRLKMQSFRGIGDLTLDFHEKEPTVLIGNNGVGKSSILDCLAVLLSQFTGRLAQNDVIVGSTNTTASIQTGQINIGEIHGHVNLNIGHNREAMWSGERDLKIRDFSDQDLYNGYKETFNEITTLLNSQKVNWFISKVQKGKSTATISDFEKLETAINEIRHLLESNSEANLPLVVYYPVNRAVIDIALEIQDEHLFEQIDAYDQALNGVQISFNSFFQWFKVLEDLENEERRDIPEYRNHQLESVRKAIYSLLSGFSNLRVRRSPLRMTVKKQGQELIINQLSDGEKCLLAMVGDLARRLAIANPSLPDPLQGSGVVLIDEIELHLHPKWQREIISALTRIFPNCQFIVTTHSPQVISQVKPEGIFILEKTNEGVVAKRPESSFGRDSNRILEDLMGVPARPQEIKDRLHELFRLIDEGNLDGARQLSQEIADIIGQDEPELVKASVSIRRKEILKR